MQSIMSAFKRSSDKKQKKLLQYSTLSSSDSSYTQNENERNENSFTPPAQRSRSGFIKPMQLLRTPSTAQIDRSPSTPEAGIPYVPPPARVIMTDVVNFCDSTCSMQCCFTRCPRLTPALYLQPTIPPSPASFSVPAGRERSMLGSVSKLRKGSGYNRLERSSDTVSSPAYTPSRLRPSTDVVRSPAKSARKHRSLKAAEDRAIATENLQPLVSNSSDNVQARAAGIIRCLLQFDPDTAMYCMILLHVCR